MNMLWHKFWAEERFRIRVLLLLAFAIRFISILPLGSGINYPLRDQNTYYSLARALVDDGYLGVPREARGPYVATRDVKQARPEGFYPAFHDSMSAVWEAEGRLYGVVEWGKPNSFFEPVYPLFSAAMYILFGDNFFFWRLVNILLSSALVYFVYDLGKRAFRDERIGTWAALYACFYPHYLFYGRILMAETLLILMLALIVWAYFRLLDQPRFGWALLLGSAFGIFVLTRSFLIAYFPVALILIVIFTKDRRRFALGGVAALGLMLTLAPWVYRNYRVQGQFLLLSTRSGYNLWMRNNPYFIEDEYAAMGVKFSPEYLDKLHYREYILGYPAFRPEQGELERNEILSLEGMKFLRANPGFFFKLCWIRFQWTIGWRGIGLGPLQNMISLISYGPILLGFVASLIWGWGRLSAVLPLWSLVGYFVLFYSLMHEGLRYRLPADSLMMLLAVFTAVTIYDRYLKRGNLPPEPSHA